MRNFLILIMCLVFTGLESAYSAVPLSSSTRPFIWASMGERDAILDKIANHSWAASQQTALINRVQGDLNSFLADEDAYLRELPIEWTRFTPRFYTTRNEVNNAWRGKLDVAQDCSVIYYLTGDTRYAELAAGVLHNSVRWLLTTPKSSNNGIGGWTFHDSEWLYESRSIGSQMPIIYDFLHGYLQSNTVYDVHEGTQKTFSFSDAQSVLTQMRNLTRDKGYAGTNWCALMGESMILNTLAIDNVATRNTFVDEFLHTDFQRQDSMKTQHDHFDGPPPYSCYPESLGYSKGVVERNSYCVSLVDRYDPSKNYPAEFPKLIQGLHRTKQMHFPNNSYQVQFGDGHRMSGGGLNYSLAHMLYSQAKAQGRTDLMALYGGPLAEGIASGKYRRTLGGYSSLGMKNQVLTLLWGSADVDETPKPLDLFRTDTLPYSGLVLQRNFSPNGNNDDGLMCFVQGAGFVHSHAGGMNMELYGHGKVLGVKGYGRGDYARSFASANTVIVNGYSRGSGGWGGVDINTVQVKSMEPATRADAVSSNLSFSCTTFADNKGSGAEATQERTMALIRTSPTTGFYFDLYRSNSSLGGEYHDYLYHNIGTSLTVEDSTGTPLAFTSAPNRFVNDTDGNKSPGWGFLRDPKATDTVTDSVRAQFATPFSGQPTIYMNMHIPGDSGREYATAMGPSDGEHPNPYKTKDIPTLIIRRNGEAWNNPFAVIFEPHEDGVDGGTVQQVTSLKNGSKVVGMKVESVIDGQAVIHYIIANTGASDTYTDATAGFSFTGRFGIVADFGQENLELYIGDGSAISYGDYSITSVSGNTQASMLIQPGQEPVVNANDPVTTTQSAPITSGLVAHWPLDEGTGTVATDVTGHGFDGDLLNGATWGSDAERGTYAVFDGNDDRISTPFKYALADTNNFTWTWWAKKAPTTHANSIMVGNRYGGSGTENLEFIKFMPPKASFANTDSAGNIEDYNYADLPSDEWHHYAMVKSGTSYQWYVDGVAEGSPVTINYNETSLIPFLIGGDGDGKPNEHFEGCIDDVVLYYEALTPEEVGYVKNGFYPYAPLVNELIAGWDTWDSSTAPSASVLAPNVTGSAVTTTEQVSWNTTDERGASNDGDWGTFAGPPSASTNVVDGENLTLPNATTGGTITFTVTNTGAEDIVLGNFHFDAYAFRPVAPRTYELSVLAGGGITAGSVYASPVDAITSVGGANDNGAHDDIDISLEELADHTLDAGESVQFLLAFSGGAGEGLGHHLFVDNVGITGAYIPEPPVTELPMLEHSMSGGDMVFNWTGGNFKVQSRTNLVEGIWQDVPGGDTPPVTNSTTDPEAFFRLIEQ